MLRRNALLAALAISFVLVGTAALALEQTNGQGTTHDGGHLGFNAKADLTGNLEYHNADNSFSIHCND